MDDTKKRILEAATEQFVQKGFSGTSISDIAKAAKINQSLIYHHIGNKQSLWHEVKNYLIGEIPAEEMAPMELAPFIEHIIKERLAIYDRDPRIARLVQWQNLEENKEGLASASYVAPSSWSKTLELFQQQGKVRKDYPALILTVYIHSLINGLLLDSFKIFQRDNEAKKLYLKLIYNEIMRSIKNN
jgi:AcrR family transcriptional regulator